MAADRFEQLLAAGDIGEMTLKNRLVVTAMGVNLAETDGSCGERMIAYHRTQAQGGAGMIICGATGVAWPDGAVIPNQSAISDDHFIPGLRQLADAVHAHDCKLAVQLHQGGLNALEDAIHGRPIWTPSRPKAGKSDAGGMFLPEEIEHLMAQGMAKAATPEFKELTLADIATVVTQFAEGARRAKQAGIDAVEIHGGHGYLLSSFLSPYKNRREDEYGGPLENRARFLLEVIRAVRDAVGPAYPILCKMDSREVGTPGGITLDDAVKTAAWIEKAGASAITVSAYHNTDRGILHSASHTPQQPALNLPAAAAIKRAVGIPIIASGRVEPEVGNAAIAAGELDFLAMGRKLLADPALPSKLAAGEVDNIRPCIYCYTCISAIYTRHPVRCAVNAELGFEDQATPVSVQDNRRSQRHIAIVGGGPAGMEAARRLDAAGCKVTLFEAGPALGGTLQFAALAYEPNQRLLQWLIRQVKASNVTVRLNTAATSELLKPLKADTVIVATGALRALPDIPGARQDHVFSGDDMRALITGQGDSDAHRRLGLINGLLVSTAAKLGLTRQLGLVRWVTRIWMPFARDITIVGGGLVGLELAEFLIERGRSVSIIDSDPVMGSGLAYVRRMRVITELKDHGATLYAGANDISIGEHAVTFNDNRGAPQSIASRQVVVAAGASANPQVTESLESEGLRVIAIGDCTGVGYIEGAIRGATEAVRELMQSSPAIH